MQVSQAVILIGVGGERLVEFEVHTDSHQLGRRLRAVDLTDEACLEPLLELADMVVVCVGDHQGVDLGRGDREGPRIVEPLPFGFALQRSAVDDHVLVVRGYVEEVDRTRHRTTGAVGLVEQRRVAGTAGVGDLRHEGAELRLRRDGLRREGGVVEQRAEDGADVGGGGILRSIHTLIGSLAPDLGGGALGVVACNP